MKNKTVPSHYINKVLKHVKSQDVIELLLSNAKLSTNVLANDALQVDVEKFCNLLKQVQDLSDDEGLGYYKRIQRIGTLEVMIGYMAAASTVKQALEFVVEYYSVLDIGIELSIEESDEFFQVKINTNEVAADAWVYIETLGKIYRIIIWLSNRLIHIYKVFFPASAAVYIKDYAGFFRAPVSCDAPYAKIVFTQEQIKAPLYRRIDDIKKKDNNFRYSLLLMSVEPISYVDKVRSEIKQRLPEDCSYTCICSALFIHPQTLRRRLSEEGATFKQIKLDIIKELAIEYLNNGFSNAEIAYLLNFSEPSSFHRAFKKWTGVSPLVYKKSFEKHEY